MSWYFSSWISYASTSPWVKSSSAASMYKIMRYKIFDMLIYILKEKSLLFEFHEDVWNTLAAYSIAAHGGYF